MRVIVCDNPDEAADLVTREILEALQKKPDLVLGLATGSTPVGVYERLVRAHREESVSFSRVRTFNLDEYIGLPPDHPQSYHQFMRENLFDGIDLHDDSVHFPPHEGPALQWKCEQYECSIRAARGLDIQVLGIGSNGHIGFNEPTSSLASRTRLVTLTEKTMLDNSRFFSDGEVQPSLASTMGIATIMDARRILLQAFGEKKAEAIQNVVEGPVSSLWPGSVLQMHPDVTLYIDEGSASRLQSVDYYRRARQDMLRLEGEGLL